jgi:hypothetical protein
MGPRRDLRAAEVSELLILPPFGSFDFNWALALRRVSVSYSTFAIYISLRRCRMALTCASPENYDNNVNTKRGAAVAPSAPQLRTRLDCQPVSSYHQLGARKERYGQNG